MTTTVRAPQRTRPARAPQPASRPRLEVVRPPARLRRTPSTRLIVAGGVVLFVLLFVLAGFQALLVSSQERIDELDRQVAIAQDRYQDLRVEVARLEAPDRIMNTATLQLGMVPSGPATYVTPSDAVAAELEERAAAAEADDSDARADGAAAGDVNDVANDTSAAGDPSASFWPEVKPYLEPSP